MPRKAKFRPRITRIKLNPEQAVLACNCQLVGQNIRHNPWGAYDNVHDGVGPICNIVHARWVRSTCHHVGVGPGDSDLPGSNVAAS